jgi:hypothetical protein
MAVQVLVHQFLGIHKFMPQVVEVVVLTQMEQHLVV